MCGIWTQRQWQDAASKQASRYSVIGTFQNAEGQTAIQVKELGGTFSDLYWNIYSEDGQDANVYTAPGEANNRMASRGFTPVVTAQVDTAGVIPVETATPETPDDGLVRVQGKTLEEWGEIGKQNKHLPEALHVHPKHPRETGEDRPATEEETEAFVNSMTLDEAMEGLSIILGVSAFA